jgi:hypothetical protein
MKMRAFSCLLALIIILGGAIGVEANMRCGNLIVEEGTNGLEIQAECGAPVAKEKFFLDKYGDVDKWTYGPDAGYIYVIYLFMGKVVEIEEIQQ